MRLWVVGVVALGLAVAPGNASACTQPDGVVRSWPADGAALPVNGVMIASGRHLGVGDFVLRVDGVQAELDLVDRFTSRDTDGHQTLIGLRPAVEIAPGSVVELEHCPNACTPVGTWPVTEPDRSAPTPISSAYFDVQVHPGCGSSSCVLGGGVDYSVYSHVESDQVLDEPRIGVVRLYTTAPLPLELFARALDGPSDTFVEVVSESVIEHAHPATPLCLEVRVFDQAGNEAPGSRTTCTPCHRVYDPSGNNCGIQEPQWGDDDVADGSDCEGTVIEPLAPLDPLPPPGEDPESGSDDGAGSTSDGDTTGDSTEPADGTTGDDPPLPPPGADPPASSGETGNEPAADDGLEVEGCSCRTTTTTAPRWAWLSVLLLAARRRR